MHLPPILKIWLLKWQFLPEISHCERGEKMEDVKIPRSDQEIYRFQHFLLEHFPYLRWSPVHPIPAGVWRLRRGRRGPQSTRDDVPQCWLFPGARGVGDPARIAGPQHRVLRGGSVLGDGNTVGTGDCGRGPAERGVRAEHYLLQLDFPIEFTLLWGGAIKQILGNLQK